MTPGEWVAFGLIIFSAAMHATMTAVIKQGADKLVLRAHVALAYAVIGLAFTPFFPLPSLDVWLFYLVVMAVHFAYQALQAASLTHADFTVAYPITRGTGPIVVALSAPYLLGDVAAPGDWVGIALVSGSIIALGLARAGAAGGPTTKGLVFSVLTGVGAAAYTLVDAHGVRLAENPMSFIVWFFVADCILVNLWCLARRRTAWRAGLVRDWRLSLSGGALAFLSFTSALMAFRVGNATELAAVRETSIIFATLIGVIWLKEAIHARRIVAIAGIVAGVIVIKLA